MKKGRFYLDDFISFDDYKIDYVATETRRNLESTERWLYLGADARDCNFAKIGLTMGDLSSRSYSSGNPNYYLFCAFKCRYDLPKTKLKGIEEDILAKFEILYRHSDGSTKRLNHHESGLPSECFSPVDFLDFFINLHFEIYESHRNSFVICGMENTAGEIDGEYVDCIFNKKIAGKNKYISMIVQY